MTAEARSDWRPGFAVQMAIAMLYVAVINATRPTVTYHALTLGASTVEIGLVQSAFSLLPAFIAVWVGRVVDRLGTSPFMIASTTILALGGILATYSSGLWLLALSQVAMGLGHIMYLVASQALVANVGPREGRETRFGTYSMMISIGQLVGPAVAAAILGGSTVVAVVLVASVAALPPPPASFREQSLLPDSPEALVFLAATLLSVVATGLACLLPRLSRRSDRPQTPPPEGGPSAWAVTRTVLRRPGMLAAMFVSIVVISTLDAFVAYLPAYGELTGLSVALVGLLLSVRAGAALVSRVFMGPIIARLGRGRLLATTMTMAGISLMIMPFVRSEIGLITVFAIVGLGLGLVQPLTIAWVANRSPRAERGTALGVRITGNRAALLVVPTLLGAIAGTAGLGAIFLVCGVSLAVGAAIALVTGYDDPVTPNLTGSTPTSESAR
jgi:MFS family permease